MGDFQDAVRQDFEVFEEFATAAQAVVGRFSHLPIGTACAAMTDLAQQHRFQKVAGSQPVDDLQSIVGLLAAAGLDSMRAFATLVAAEPVPIWSHLVVARSALEAFGYVRWLTETPLATSTRIRRGLLMRLRDAFEMARYDPAEFKEMGRNLKEAVRAVAEANEWEVSFSKRTIGGDEVIPAKLAIDKVLGGAGGSNGVGPVMWSYFSGASHAFPYALIQSASKKDSDAVGPVVMAGLFIDTNTVHILAAGLLLAGLIAWEARCSYMGWSDPLWLTATSSAREHLKVLHSRLGAAEQ